MSNINLQINQVNSNIVNKYYNQQKTQSDLYKQLGDAVEKHKLELTNLIELAQNTNNVDETIIKRLDDSVELLLTTIDTIQKIPKENESGLGYQMIPPIYDMVIDTDKQCTDNTVLRDYRLPLPQNLAVYVTLVPPTVSFKYNCNNVDFPLSLVSYVLTNSSNIMPSDPSATLPTPPIVISVDDFKTKMLSEITKMSAVSGTLYFEQDRMNDLALNYKNIATDLKIV